MIDQLLERYLMGFKKNGVIQDVFENPTKQELRELEGMYRFIADAKKKKVYVFSHNLFHELTWLQIKTEIKDPRNLYQANDLFAGAIESNRVFNWGFNDRYYDWEAVEHWMENPAMFSFAKKYGIDIDVWMKKNQHKMKDFVGEFEDYA
jgi:hypothetical protein